MKIFNFTIWALLGVLLFPILFLALAVYPAWEKWADKEGLFITLIWIVLAPIMVFSANISQNVYPKWEKFGEEF